VATLGGRQPLREICGRSVDQLAVFRDPEVERPAAPYLHPPGRVGADHAVAGLRPVLVEHPLIEPDLREAGITGQDVSRKLREGTPSIGVRPDQALLVGVWMMEPGEEKVVARRLREVFEKKA